MTKKEKNKNIKAVSNWINYEDKVPLIFPEIPDKSIINANDMNSIKWTVMQGIPIFWEGQTIMFAGRPRLDKFLLQFHNLVPTIDYTININQGYLFAGNDNQDFKVMGSGIIDIKARHLPIDKLFLQNDLKNNFLGQLLFFQSVATSSQQERIPTSGGSRYDSSFAPSIKYFVQMNQTGKQEPLSNYPQGLTVCIILFLRNIYPQDIKKD